ncbi:Ldh family oxidoreductase [Bacillus sp. Marseille-P3661]|uniref:Ldh family oxidoreductase n=1 Tax=Bacillus sp. Marseille-P3661 TaxID=1936234 RepID=UPI000C818CB3|nr:Ldh family oxidoreductase [Bacillus sp. Marseille-P3661]
MIVSAELLRDIAKQSFDIAGLDKKMSEIIADVLVDADLRGIHSHGIHNLPRYTRGFIEKQLNAQPNFNHIVDNGIFSVIDGDNTLGVLGANYAMELAIERAKQFGIGLVGVRNSSHFGPAYYYSKKAIEHNMIGFSVTNGRDVMAPWGGRKSLISNNPFSYAIPAGDESPIILDIACSVSARGRIRMMARNDQPIPENWALDKDGDVTTNAWEALGGSVLPFGGHKGYGIAVVNEVLSAVLTGALLSFEQGENLLNETNNVQSNVQTAWGCGHLFGALDISKFTPVDEFKTRVDFMISTFKTSPKAKDVQRIYLPGEIENELFVERLKSGIPLNSNTVYLIKDFLQNEVKIKSAIFQTTE